MTREEAAKLLPILQAFAEGRDIEYFDTGSSIWRKSIDPAFDESVNYRIKPEPKYRPFKDAEECWNEMLKHKPLGWVKNDLGTYRFICYIKDAELRMEDQRWTCNELFRLKFTFVDGTPFGIGEE